jgi:hypothetical protein
MCLTGDDLPITVALKPRVNDVITRFQILAENRLRFVRVITKNRGVPNDPALSVFDLDRSRISSRQRCDIRNQFRFVENASFFVAEDAVISEMFFLRRLVAGYEGIVKLLRAASCFMAKDELFVTMSRELPGRADMP